MSIWLSITYFLIYLLQNSIVLPLRTTFLAYFSVLSLVKPELIVANKDSYSMVLSGFSFITTSMSIWSPCNIATILAMDGLFEAMDCTHKSAMFMTCIMSFSWVWVFNFGSTISKSLASSYNFQTWFMMKIPTYNTYFKNGNLWIIIDTWYYRIWNTCNVHN